MAKRFTDTNKYKKPFIRSLKGAYKLLWDYLYHDCDHAGIWIVDFEIAQLYIGSDMPINKDDALSFFNTDEKRIIEFDGGKKWFIPSFISFQYGELNPENRAHNSVIIILTKNNLLNPIKPLNSSIKGAMDKDKDKEVIKVNEVRAEQFEKFWKYYKKGCKKDAMAGFMKLKDSDIELMRVHLPVYFQSTPDKKFRKDAERYISKRLWENDDIDELTQKLELPENWFNIDLEPKYWALLTPEQVKRKKLQDARRSMGV